MAKKSTTKTTKQPTVSNKRQHNLNFKPVDEQEYSVIKYDDA
jgi:hypothetical protein